MKIISTNADVVENREFIIREIISALKVERIVLPKISTIENGFKIYAIGKKPI